MAVPAALALAADPLLGMVDTALVGKLGADELAALGVVGVAGLGFGITPLEWGLIGFTAMVVLALEAVNTAVEAVVDLASPQIHPLAKIAKDAAAGAMVLAVIGSVLVALAVFGPRLWAWLG